MAVFDNTPCTTLNVKVTVGQIVTKQGWWPSKVLSLNTSPVRCYVGNSLCCRDLTPATLKTWKAATTAPHMIRVADRPKVATEKELRRRLDQSDCYPLLLTGNIQVAEYYEFEPQKCVLNSGIAATGVSLKQGCDCFPFGVENVWTFTDGEAVDLVMEVSFRRCRLDGAFILVLSTSPLWSKLPSEVKRMILSYAPIPGPPHTCSLHEKAWRRAPLWEDSASNTKFLQISAPSARFLLIDNTYPYCRR
ncbi:hypothetical protein Pelo_8076 [Pelomyxa schiedti]|nr:hypothetical protein Pelo_8076 [Pelomyxa schiedti]